MRAASSIFLLDREQFGLADFAQIKVEGGVAVIGISFPDLGSGIGITRNNGGFMQRRRFRQFDDPRTPFEGHGLFLMQICDHPCLPGGARQFCYMRSFSSRYVLNLVVVNYCGL